MKRKTTGKWLAALFMAALLAGAVGCSSDTASQDSAAADSTMEQQTAQEAPAAESEYYFADGVLVSEDVRIEITDWKVIPVGEAGNEYGDTPVIAFWYDITNLSGNENVSPLSWIAMFTAIQDNNPNKVNELEVGLHPDGNLVDDQMSTIKEGGTLQGAIAYNLTDETTPVVLKATRGLGGEDLGEQTFEIA